MPTSSPTFVVSLFGEEKQWRREESEDELEVGDPE
jgi:hypothetical protein